MLRPLQFTGSCDIDVETRHLFAIDDDDIAFSFITRTAPLPSWKALRGPMRLPVPEGKVTLRREITSDLIFSLMSKLPNFDP
jgi:hypothetical protein